MAACTPLPLAIASIKPQIHNRSASIQHLPAKAILPLTKAPILRTCARSSSVEQASSSEASDTTQAVAILSQVNAKASIQAESNFGNETMEQIKNNAPEALFRELISNAYDAGAKEIYCGPLYGQGEVTGLFFIDDGVGLSLKSIEGNHKVDEKLFDEEERICGSWKAFVSKGMSSKSDSKYIGHKVQGTKLLLYCNKILMVVSRSAGDKNWGCWFQEKPVDTMLQKNMHRAPTIEIDVLNPTKAQECIENELSVLNGNPSDESRWQVYLKKEITELLKKPSGTLIIELGIQDYLLKGLLDGLDKFSTDGLDSNSGINTLVKDGPKNPDNFIYLLWFMRLKTIIGHPLYVQGLGDFDAATIEEETKANMLVERGQLPTLKVLTSGKDRQDLQWRDVGIGFPYPKIIKRKDSNLNANPETVRDWNYAVFQARYLKTFMVEMNKFTVSLCVDGPFARQPELPYLNRRGGSARDRIRSGIPISHFEGVAIYVRGVYVCNYNKIMQELGGDYQSAADSKHFLKSIFMIINGDFDIQANRNGLTAESKKKLLRPEFIKNLKETLDHFRKRGGTNHFDGLLKKCNKQAGLAAVEMAETSWKDRMSALKSQDRFKVRIQNYAAHFDEAHASTSRAIEAQHHTEFVFIEPSEGKENSVISIYNQLSTVLTPEYFENAGAKELQRLWPVILETSGGEGIDCLGVSLDDKPTLSRLVENMGNVIPSGDILNIEFKYLFRIPINEDGDKFNHPFHLTDFIICWEFSWPGRSTRGSTNPQLNAPVGGIVVDVAEGNRVYDIIGRNGQISSTMKDQFNNDMTIPASMKDFCFFITDIRDTQQNEVQWPDDRPARRGVTVIALKQLIEATFNLPEECDVKSKVEWCRAENKKKAASKRGRRPKKQ